MKTVQVPEYNTAVNFPDNISESEMKRVLEEKFPSKISEAEREVGKYLPGMVPKLWREREISKTEEIQPLPEPISVDPYEGLTEEDLIEMEKGIPLDVYRRLKSGEPAGMAEQLTAWSQPEEALKFAVSTLPLTFPKTISAIAAARRAKEFERLIPLERTVPKTIEEITKAPLRAPLKPGIEIFEPKPGEVVPKITKAEKRGKQVLSRILAEEPVISTPLQQAQVLGWRADRLERLTPEDLNLVLAEQLTPKEASITPTGKLVSFKRATPVIDLPPKDLPLVKKASTEVEAILAKILKEEGPSIAETGWKATDVPGFALLPVTDIATQESDPGERQLALLAAAVMTMPILLITRGQLLARLPNNPKIQKAVLAYFDKMPKIIQERILDVKVAPWMVGSGQVGQWSGGVLKVIPVGKEYKSLLIPWKKYFKEGVSPEKWVEIFKHETGHVFEGFMTKESIPKILQRMDELSIQVNATKIERNWAARGYGKDKKVTAASETFADVFETLSPEEMNYVMQDVFADVIATSKRDTAMRLVGKTKPAPHPTEEQLLPTSKALRSSVALRDKSTGGIYTSEGATSHLEVAEKRGLLAKPETLERGWIIEGKYYNSQKEALEALYSDTITKLKTLEPSPLKSNLEKILKVAETKIPKPLMSKLREERGSFIWGRGRKTQPPVELPPSADNVELMYQATHDAMEELTKLPKGAIRQKFVHSTIDISGNVKRELLQKGGVLGREAIIQKDLLAGLPAKTNQLLEPIQASIYGDLSKADERLLNEIISSRRTIAIEAYKPDIKSPWGQNAAAHRAWLSRQSTANPQKFAELNAKAEEFYAVAREQLDDLLAGGLIDQKLHTKLYSIDYEPREFIHHIDTIVGQESGTVARPGVLIDIHNSGIKALKEGSYNLLNLDSRKFLHQIVARTQARIARNDANKVLLDIATQIPNNGIVSLVKAGQDIPTGYTSIKTFIGGKPKEMMMPVEMATEWRQADPGINRLLSETLSWLSGAKIVRALATGYNPAFAITNIPRDLQLLWMGTKEYSAVVPKALAQMTIDAKAVWQDTLFRRGRFNDYLNEGGGMELLAHYGRVGGSGEVNKFSRILGYIGETSEIGSRLMLRERAIKNLRTKFPNKSIEEIQREATWIARSYLDFNQGGQYVKAIDTVIPYLNATVQATRTLARAAKSDPKTFMWKSAQLLGIAVATNLANRMINPEGYAQVSPQEKAANWIFMLPENLTRYVDRKGNTRYWFPKIAKDQGQRVISTLGDAIVDRLVDGKIPTDQFLKSLQDLMPVGPDIPPTTKLFYSYILNKDFWTNEDLWKGSSQIEPAEQWHPGDTPPGFVRMGKALGMSPAKLHGAGKAIIPYSNPFVTMMALSYETISGDLVEEVRRKVPIELLLEEPSVRRLTGRTSPYVQVREEEQEIRKFEATKNFVQNRTVDDLTERGLRRKDQKLIQESISYIGKQDPVDQDRLAERMLLMKTYINLPDRSWWINLRQTSDPETRAMVFYAKYLKVPKTKQDEMVQILTSTEGLISERFAIELLKLKRGKK